MLLQSGCAGKAEAIAPVGVILRVWEPKCRPTPPCGTVKTATTHDTLSVV